MVFNRGIFRSRLFETLCLSLFFLALSFYVAGYNFGRYIDIAYVKNFLDPSLFAKDTLLFHHLESPYLYFHKAVAFLASWTGLESNLEVLFVILYGIVTFFTLFALIKITDHLFQNRKTTILFLFLFILNCRLISLGEPSLHLTEFAPQVVARPFLLFSLYFFLRKKYLVSLAIAGIAFNIHLATAAYLLGIYAIYFIYHAVSTRKFDALNVLKPWGICILLALPTIIPIIGMIGPPEGMEPWMLELRRYMIYGHSSPTLLFTLDPGRWQFSIFGAVMIAIAIWKTPPEKEMNKIILIFFSAVGIMYLLGYIFVDIHLTHLFQTIGILRATWFVMLLGLMYVANLLRVGLENKYIHASVILLFFLSLVFDHLILYYCSIVLIVISIGAAYIGNEKLKYLLKIWFPVICIAVLILLNAAFKFVSSYQGIIHEILNKLSISNLMLILLAIGLISFVVLDFIKENKALFFKQISLVALLFISIILPFHSISIHSSASPDWRDVQIWSNTTPKGSLFIIPPEYMDFYDYSNRPVVFNRSSLGTMVMNPEKINETLEILADMGIDLKEVVKEKSWSVQLRRDAWYKITDSQFQALAEKYDAQYIIRERALPLNFEKVYENRRFVVYKIN